MEKSQPSMIFPSFSQDFPIDPGLFLAGLVSLCRKGAQPTPQVANLLDIAGIIRRTMWNGELTVVFFNGARWCP
jgi:hypothetical protein